MLINKSRGITPSERFLANLAEKTFLNLWSYPNVFKEQTGGKELCDLLVVFNNHIIIFSDKSIEFKNKNGINEDWKKWAKKAIVESSNQIFGAERWIKRFPDRISLDAKCNEKFPFQLAKNEDMIIHRIVLASFSGNELKEHIGNSGAFTINPSIIGEEKHLNTPFTVGQINEEKGFIHIMNETSLEVLMTELDTISDFTTYLQEKEKFILSGQLHKAYSEEDLLSVYLENVDDEEKHSFKFENEDLKIEIEKKIWQNHKNNHRYLLKNIEDKTSYIWDSMINRFTNEMLNQRLIEQSVLNPLELNKVLKIMASENRLNRRSLAKTFIDLFEKYKQFDKNKILKRVVIFENNDKKAYVFLITNKPENWKYEDYQNERKYQLFNYMMSLKGKYPNLLDIVGISREAVLDESSSNDILYIDGRNWNKEDEEEADEIFLKYGYLKDENIEKFSREEVEYPYKN